MIARQAQPSLANSVYPLRSGGTQTIFSSHEQKAQIQSWLSPQFCNVTMAESTEQIYRVENLAPSDDDHPKRSTKCTIPLAELCPCVQ
jgi:hypothetical protein